MVRFHPELWFDWRAKPARTPVPVANFLKRWASHTCVAPQNNPSKREIRAVLSEMHDAVERLSDRPARQEEAEGHRLLLEHLALHESHPDNPNLSATTIVRNARRFLRELDDPGSPPPA